MSEQFTNTDQIFDYLSKELKRGFNLELSRRDFMKIVAGGMLGALVAGINTGKAQAQSNNAGDTSLYTRETLPNGVASGDVTQTTAVLWTRSTVTGTVQFQVLDNSGTIITEASAEVTEALLPVKVQIADLDPGTAYRYQATDSAGNQLEGQFRTLAESGRGKLRFGVSGDWDGILRPYVSVANIPGRELDFFVAHGDTVYADHPSIDVPREEVFTLDEFRIKHNEVYSSRFSKNYLAALRTSTPLYATIDDHEVRNDFAGWASPQAFPDFRRETADYINQTELYRNGLQTFSEYHPIEDRRYEATDDPRMEARPKLYRYVHAGETAAIYIIDQRSFRDIQVNEIGNLLSAASRNQWQQDVWQPGRTMLGRTQVEDLKRDLLDAQQRGVVWKFIMMPGPVMQLTWLKGEDRWEGYAPERTEVFQFIEDQGITNVVFVSADIHATFISALTYQTEPGGDLIDTSMWEITTGAVAKYPPSGIDMMETVTDFGILLPYERDDYTNGTIHDKDAVLENIFNRLVLLPQRLRPLGLDDAPIDYDLIAGSWTAGHSYGWTEFDIEADNNVLTVTTYGVPGYTPEEMTSNPELWLNIQPEIYNQFRVRPIV